MSEDNSLQEALARCLKKGLTFAAFRRPGAPVALWAQRNPEIETVDGSLLWEVNDVFLVAPFVLDPERIAMIRSDVDLSFGELGSDISALFECAGGDGAPAEPVSDTEQQAYIDAVEAAKTMIRSGAMEKVVLSRTRKVSLQKEDMDRLFLQACADRPHAFVVLMNTPMHGTWLGASPERLVLAEEDRIRVDALAGTMASDNAPADPAGWGMKERNEQQLVTTSVLETFERTGAKNVVAFPPETIGAGEVVHLCSRIEADLGEAPLSDVVLALHPTPAVCGTPTDVARQFIQKHEAHERGLYTGFWGPWYPDGRTELYVNIRCLRHSGAEAVIYSGAGITGGSDPLKEWEETEQKAQTWLRPIQGLA
jgi:isochorismate synthase